jgi:hypothetical protein
MTRTTPSDQLPTFDPASIVADHLPPVGEPSASGRQYMARLAAAVALRNEAQAALDETFDLVAGVAAKAARGYYSYGSVTYEEIGKVLGTSKQAVSQMYKRRSAAAGEA